LAFATAARRRPHSVLRQLTIFGCLGVGIPIAMASQAEAANQVRISALSDVTFGTVPSVTSDTVRSQNICLYAKTPPNNSYRITASGSGSGGAFLLTSGSDVLPYDVQWADTSGQTTGNQLISNQPLTAQQSSVGAGDPGDCSKGPANSASLIIILRSAALAAAASGTYNGTLTLLVAAE